MGTYVTSSAVVSRLGTARAAQLTTDSGATPDTTMIDGLITSAEAEVMGAVLKRTSTTLDEATHPNTWALVAGKVMALVVYELSLRREPVPEDVKDAHKAAIQGLQDLVDGKRELPDACLCSMGTTWGSVAQDADRADMA